MSDRQAHAAEFRRLHDDGLLLLPNVWDGGSARQARACSSTPPGSR